MSCTPEYVVGQDVGRPFPTPEPVTAPIADAHQPTLERLG